LYNGYGKKILIWGCSSVGRAPALQAGGRRFEPAQLHHFHGVKHTSFINICMSNQHKHRECPRCGISKRMPKHQVYCSQTCMALVKRDEKINLWLAGGDVKTTRGKTQTAHWIRDYLIEKHDSKCSECGWGKINPHTNTLPLELEHIDGDFTNNSPDNLTILCPSCHSLTATYKGANRKVGRPRAKYYRGL